MVGVFNTELHFLCIIFLKADILKMAGWLIWDLSAKHSLTTTVGNSRVSPCLLFLFSFHESNFYLYSRSIIWMAVQLRYHISSVCIEPCFASIFFFFLLTPPKFNLAVSFACFIKDIKESIMSKFFFASFC